MFKLISMASMVVMVGLHMGARHPRQSLKYEPMPVAAAAAQMNHPANVYYWKTPEQAQTEKNNCMADEALGSCIVRLEDRITKLERDVETLKLKVK